MITLAVVTTGWLLALSLAAALWRQQRQRRRLEKLLEKMKAEKSQKGRFLAHVAHEIRTPLNGITGLATLLAQSDLTPQEERRLKGHLSASAQQLMDLVNDVLDSSKLEEGRMVLVPEDFIVRNWIESVVYPQKGLARKKGVSIEVTYEGDSRRTLRADVGKLTQILGNLVGNAVKFTDKGQVSLLVRVPSEAGGTLSLSVRDPGIGMTRATQRRLFERFSQADLSSHRKYGGTGLGLFIVHELLKLMGGRISVQSEVGKGSVFEVTFPVEAGTSPATTTPNSGQTKTLESRSLNCLVADDSDVNRLVLRRFLERLGHTVVDCVDGAEALKQASHQSFDVIFMDCEMPVMDGFTATREIRRREDAASRTKVIAVTAGFDPEDRSHCLEAGMDHYLPKPFSLDQLREVLQACHGEKLAA